MNLKKLSDLDLISQFQDALVIEQENLVHQLDFISEIDQRKLFYHYSSLWALLIHEHGMSEWTAETRILAARLIRRLPIVREWLLLGRLNLSLIEMAQACANREKLGDEEFLNLLDSISGKTCKKARQEIATRYPKYQQHPRDEIRPIDEEHSEIRFIAKNELLDEIDQVRGLLAHSHPQLGLGEMFSILAKDFFAQRKKQPPRSPVTTEVASRTASLGLEYLLTQTQGYECSYTDPKTGIKCTSTYALEKDHIHSWVKGGKTELKNLRYLCRNHHARVSFLEFGDIQKYLR